MLSFKITPGPLVPAGQRAEYRIEADRVQTIDIRLTDSQTDELLGTKRFAEVAEARFDAAPIVRRHLRFLPKRSRASGFVGMEDRCRTVIATAVSADDPDHPTVSEASVYYAGTESATVPSFITTMPLQRLIAPGEQDELTLLSEEAPWITITAEGPDGQTRRTFTTFNSYVNPFRLHADDFPGAERIAVESRSGGKVEYTVLPAPQGARRIAWRSSAGSIEHYTFPTEAETTVEVSKTRIRGAEGRSTVAVATEQCLRLRSAYETPEVLEALAGIVASPEVWLAEGDRYIPLDVTTDRAVIRRHGTLSLLEIEIRLQEKNALSWK
ncbi:MAG: hypothetical protein NC209_06515 [Alistipes sp.]|nr:hypothetical protein [Alistipes senegalensis]MCM1250777.1 hypothetical protein [Alistipes sp.]